MKGIVFTRKDYPTWGSNKIIVTNERGIIVEHTKYKREVKVYFPRIEYELYLYPREYRKCKNSECQDCNIRFNCYTS
jgi:hypothetical protein